ncbi:MAG: glycoside hydrolase family 127 protein, partial [Sedimentisphaerales bacterium]|nr:glycoside hydrolase family 127 protein [Sedimentisphaerales bacterium]
TRRWKKGDVVQISLPMHTTIEQMPNVPDYIAFLHGPVLLAAKTGTEDLKGLIADDSRWGHIAGGERIPVDEAPAIINADRIDTAGMLIPVMGSPLVFKLPASVLNTPDDMILEPFFRIHDSRYMMYWRILTNKQ